MNFETIFHVLNVLFGHPLCELIQIKRQLSIPLALMLKPMNTVESIKR